MYDLAADIALQVAVRVILGAAERGRRDRYTAAVKNLLKANTAPLMLVPALRHGLGGRGPVSITPSAS